MSRRLQGLAAALVIAGAFPASADSGLLGICSEVEGASCSISTSWTVQESASPTTLVNPNGAAAGFQIVVTEGTTTSTLNLQDLLTLNGLLEGGTNISAIYLSVQKGDGAGNYTTVASAAVGDTSAPCGCPFVQSTMTLAAQDSTGAELQGAPLLSLAYGAQEDLTLTLNWNLSQGLVQAGDALRVQPCVTYVEDGISLPPGCFADGGGVHATRACSGFSLESCTPPAAALTETLAALTSPIATLTGFTASSSSTNIVPSSSLQTAGGGALTFSVAPTGVPGTESLLDVQGQVSCSGASGAASLADSAVLNDIAQASASIALECMGGGWSCATLGAAAPYNLFVTQGVEASDSDVEGALAAGGDVALSSYEIGASLSAGSTALVTGGNLNLSQGWINGNAWVSGAATLSSAGLSGTLHASSTLLDFAGAGSALQALSAELAALPANGTVAAQAGGALVLSGSDPAVDVFELTSAELGSTSGLTLQVPATAFVIVNVSGTSAQMVNQELNVNPAAARQLLLNLPNATTLQLSSVGVAATVLAPSAAVTFNDGAIQGALLAKSFSGTGQLNLAPPPACIPVPATQ